jgi:hypothetical protein
MLLKIIAAIGILFSLACFACAEDVAVLLDNSKPGTYLVTVDAQGVVKASPLKIVRVGKPSSPPVDPPPTDETFDQAVTRFTREALAAGGSKTTGAGLSSVYSLVSDGVSDGSIAPDKAFAAVKRASDSVINAQSDGAKWKAFRDSVGAALTKLAADGKLTTKEQISAALQRIADAMNVATGFAGNPADVATQDPDTAGILDGIDIAKLIELIKLIMELMKLFGGK